MVVRIRFGRATRIGRQRRKNQRVALAAATLLTPAAVMALVLGLWRIGADLRLSADFAIQGGLFSHWQVWIAAAFLLELCARLLNRYGRTEEGGPEPPRASEPPVVRS